jgi:hypothetical protein
MLYGINFKNVQLVAHTILAVSSKKNNQLHGHASTHKEISSGVLLENTFISTSPDMNTVPVHLSRHVKSRFH